MSKLYVVMKNNEKIKTAKSLSAAKEIADKEQAEVFCDGKCVYTAQPNSKAEPVIEEKPVGQDFPYPGTINKVCLLIFKASSKRAITNLNNLLDKTLIVSRRDSILELNLPKGSYIIIPSTYEYGKTGFYCLELHFEDELIKEETSGKNKVECLKNTYIEKLGGNSVDWEVISEFISSKAKPSNTNKEQFIMQKFKEILKDEDDYDYSSTDKKKANFNRGNSYYEEEDLDYI